MARRDRYYIGESYGGSARRNVGSTLAEWEWVHVGRSFARSHPMGQIGGGIYLILLLLLVRTGVVLWGVFQGASPFFLIFGIVDTAAILAVLRKWRIAWPLVWITLIVTVPVSLPLMLYWADGTRPNLIYRHRFERLVLPQKGSAHV